MNYCFEQDLKYIRELLGLTQAELADELGVGQITVSKNESGKSVHSGEFLEKVYGYAFDKNIKLNKLKEMLHRENIEKGHILLFHGAKSEIDGAIDIKKGRANNDFGQGFYAGENYGQSVSFISGYDKSSVYIIDFDECESLKCKKYEVNTDWVLTIAYYRGALDEYRESPKIKRIIEESRSCDYIIAPIADNRMFQIINSFIGGEITDEQCMHCLAATNLGNQYVFKSEKAIGKLKIKERCYVCRGEKREYLGMRSEDAKLGDDKVKLARIQYRGKGRYIDEMMENMQEGQ